MNGGKLEEIRQKIISMQFVERESQEPIKKFSKKISDVETKIKRDSQEVEQERQNIKRNFDELKTPTDTAVEVISFPDGLTKESEKILAEQKETLNRILAEQMVLETNLNERKSSFAKKKAELHQKFLQKKGG
ncbi:MAG: hypothetical protein IJK81_07080 [Selenomonadaceae bacterium]|nr:hypothetical protein [Selenomonadaceae bacterium]